MEGAPREGARVLGRDLVVEGRGRERGRQMAQHHLGARPGLLHAALQAAPACNIALSSSSPAIARRRRLLARNPHHRAFQSIRVAPQP
jgi:hypothetical protein